ncbi:hypothetical protein B0A48_10039 [Cryoendolithus antarcticus]|uniref:Major facilitator superfamily (MFS) profile domain-containing protein n=1 Tax=Cryoendolithus antarcticus TaxID=1507870 RepID=A0A1V8T3F1_9PEZI|nr:hypothetical protein B0A48_10039 [Cryoendolithus antarcticus]
MGIELRGNALITMILLASGLDFLLLGYDQGLLAGILPGARFLDMLDNLNPTMTGLVTAIYDIGCAFGAVAAFIWGVRIGRKKSIIIANFIVIIGAALQTACVNYSMMAVTRVVAGVGAGFSTSALIIIGVALASWLFFATLFANSSLQWRYPIACQMIFSSLVLCCGLFLCDTPRWLAQRGEHDNARHVIARLLDKDDHDPGVTGQLNEILEALNLEAADGEASWSEVFSNATKSRNLQRVLLGMGPYMMNQWSGVNALCYYLTYIFERYLGFSTQIALILASVAFTQHAVMSWPPYFYMDKLGCRWSVILSSAGCATCMALIAGCLLGKNSAGAAGAVAFSFLFLDCFTLGILPLVVFGRDSAIAIVVVMITPIAMNAIGGNHFWIWAIVCASFCPLTYFFAIETSGRTLEQIDQMFHSKPRVLMGFDKENTKVIRTTAADEEIRFKAFAAMGDKGGVEEVEEQTLAPESLKSLSGNSTGKAPFLEDSDYGITLNESTAIAEWIITKHGNGRLALRPDDPNYAEYLRWFHFANCTLQPAFVTSMFMGIAEGGPEGMAKQFVQARTAGALSVLDERLGEVKWLAGDEFTAADVMTLYVVTTQRWFGPVSLAGYGNVLRWVGECAARPAYQRAMEKGDPEMKLLLGAEPPKQSLLEVDGVNSDIWKK